MSKQAKTLTAQEIRRVLDYVATRKHSERNRAMLLTMYYAGLRVKECAALRYEDVIAHLKKLDTAAADVQVDHLQERPRRRSPARIVLRVL